MALRSTVRKVSELAIVTPMLAADADPIVRPTMAAARTNLFISLLLLSSVRRHPVFIAGDAREGRMIGTCRYAGRRPRERGRRPFADSSRQGCAATRSSLVAASAFLDRRTGAFRSRASYQPGQDSVYASDYFTLPERVNARLQPSVRNLQKPSGSI